MVVSSQGQGNRNAQIRQFEEKEKGNIGPGVVVAGRESDPIAASQIGSQQAVPGLLVR